MKGTDERQFNVRNLLEAVVVSKVASQVDFSDRAPL